MFSSNFLKLLLFLLSFTSCVLSFKKTGWVRTHHTFHTTISGLKMVAPIIDRDRGNSIIKKISNTDVVITSLQINDIFQVLSICNGHFLPVYASIFERFDLNLKILQIFLPKFLLSEKTGHSVIALKTRDSGEIIGMVDISLQTNDGTLDCLKPSWFLDRQKRYNNKLHPYICNLLVSPEYRNQGMASRLVQACEEYGKTMKKESIQTILNQNSNINNNNNNNINQKSPLSKLSSSSEENAKVNYPPTMITHMHLHVESNQIPALSLYLKQGFVEVSRVAGNDYDVIFMRKPIPS